MPYTVQTLRDISSHTKAEQHDSIYKRDYVRMRPTTAMGKSRMNEATPIVIRKMLKETLLKEAYARAEQKKMEKVGGIVVVVAAAAAAVRVIAIT